MGYTQLFEFCAISGCPVVGQVKLRCDRASKSTKGPRFGTIMMLLTMLDGPSTQSRVVFGADCIGESLQLGQETKPSKLR